jgi:hypothetical protein
MKYAKPEITLKDHAAAAIQSGGMKAHITVDAPSPGNTYLPTANAYEADE